MICACPKLVLRHYNSILYVIKIFFYDVFYTSAKKMLKKTIEFINVIATTSSQYSHKGQNILN